MDNFLIRIITESWLVLGQMAPYLLLGFLVAGVLSVCVSPAWIERRLGRRGLGPVLTASLFGVPLPLCSCGVIPISASLRRHGASRAATTAFVLSTPQTGVDSVAVTWALLGPVFALFRPLVALVTGVVGGCLVQLVDATDEVPEPEDTAPNACTDACCDKSRPRNAVLRALEYGLVTLPRDIGWALVVGIVVAGAIAALVPQNALGAYLGGGILSILVMIGAGIPIYVCATASVPIAAGLIHMGASPGAALAFLIAGPATNAAALTTAWKVLGRRATFVYLLTVLFSAVGCALLLDWLIPAAGAAVPQLGATPDAHPHGTWLSNLGAIAMLAVLVLSYGRWHGKGGRAER